MMPHFEKYAEDFKDKILFARIDVARNPLAVSSRNGVMATPTFKFFAEDVRFRRLWERFTRLC